MKHRISILVLSVACCLLPLLLAPIAAAAEAATNPPQPATLGGANARAAATSIADEARPVTAEADAAATADLLQQLEMETGPTDLPNQTPAPQPRAKNCDVQDILVYNCLTCYNHCASFPNCSGTCYVVYTGYWCDCYETPF
jgi:hypothetical protein